MRPNVWPYDQPEQKRPDAATLEGSDKFAVSSSMAQTFKPPKHLCPTHGVTKDGCVSFWEDGKPAGDYCMTCYKDMIRKFCQPVTKL